MSEAGGEREECTMPKSVKNVVIALVVLAVAAWVPISAASGQALGANPAQPEKPASIEAYERLVAELEGRPMDRPAGPV